MSVIDAENLVAVAEAKSLAGRRSRSSVFASWQGRISFFFVALIVLIAIFGPLVAPQSPIAVGVPFAPPGGDHLLGTDELGRDVFSRVLHGGVRLVLLTTAATLIAVAIGTALGTYAGYVGGRGDSVVMRTLDVILCLPPILVILVLAASAGTGVVMIGLGVILVNVPGAARVVRSATLELRARGFVEAAVLRGERTASIIRREILPNILGPLLADAGPRLSGTIILVAGLNYLGIGVNPPTPDWGAMIFENRLGLTVQPWAPLAPALMIVVFVISLNMLGDAFARTYGRAR